MTSTGPYCQYIIEDPRDTPGGENLPVAVCGLPYGAHSKYMHKYVPPEE